MNLPNTKKMKIAFLLNHLNAGGAERVVVTLANTLAGLGHEIAIILTKKTGSYLADVSPKVRILQPAGGRMLLAVFSLIPLLRREGFHCVIAGLDQPNVALLLAKPFLDKRTKCVVTEHNHPILSERSVRGWMWWFTRRLKPILYPHADHIITVNEASRRVLAEKFGCDISNISTLHNPVDVAHVQAAAREECIHSWLVERSTPVLIAAGRLAPAKDYSLMLSAMARINKTRAVRLIILGEGGLRKELEKLRDELGLTDIVDMPGFVSNPFALMARADCFIMSSHTEGLPTVMVEALASGAAVVSTDCPSGPREILEDGNFGRLVPVSDVVALSDAILAQLDAPHDPSKSRQRAFAFAPEGVARRYEALIEKLES